MKLVIRLLAAALLLGVGLLAAILAASELGGEVVVLHTYREDGMAQSTSLWIVDDHKQLWLRAGQPGSTWLERLRRQPQVELERGGRVGDYEAVLMPGQRDRINRLMREKYGWADWLIGLARDESTTLPVRLDPLTP